MSFIEDTYIVKENTFKSLKKVTSRFYSKHDKFKELTYSM